MPGIHLQAPSDVLRIEAHRLVHWPKAVVYGTVFILSVAIALLSYRYLLDVGPVPPIIAGNRFRTFWLVIHAGFASTALLLGSVQFSGRLRRSRPGLHRLVGRIYAPSCLIGAAAGSVLALGSSAGPIASLGFGSLAVIWFGSTAVGWQRARTKRFASHGRWMVRSWALTLSAVTLRIYLPLFELAGLPDLPSYRAISFLCWVPNLLVAEFLLRRRTVETRPRTDRSRSPLTGMSPPGALC